MTVSQLIEKLGEYNPDAKVGVIAVNARQEFSVVFGYTDGVTKDNCQTVSFYVDALNQSESAG